MRDQRRPAPTFTGPLLHDVLTDAGPVFDRAGALEEHGEARTPGAPPSAIQMSRKISICAPTELSRSARSS